MDTKASEQRRTGAKRRKGVGSGDARGCGSCSERSSMTGSHRTVSKASSRQNHRPARTSWASVAVGRKWGLYMSRQ